MNHPSRFARSRFFLALLGCVALTLPAAPAVFAAAETAPAASAPAASLRVFAWPAERLAALQDPASRERAALAPVFARLKADADKALKVTPPSVMDKAGCAASGDKHDYFSLAPYWWPDPAKPDGRPYIRRDGEVNPESQQGTDSLTLGRLNESVETLALAYHFLGDAAYAGHAALLMRTWFVAPATRMNPNLQYAQAIPGRNDGRGAGVLQGRNFGRLADAMTLLGDAPAWTATDRAAFRQWLADYYRWLTTAKNARDEEAAENNHGTWFDVQAAHLALVLGKTEDARARLEAARTKRLAAQIEPDGKQPRELARTKSLDYSIFNLEAMFSLARLAAHTGIDWWSYETSDKRSLARALHALAPYSDPSRPWPKQDLVAAERERIVPLLAEYVTQRTDRALQEMLARASRNTELREARWRLFYPAPMQFVAPAPR